MLSEHRAGLADTVDTEELLAEMQAIVATVDAVLAHAKAVVV